MPAPIIGLLYIISAFQLLTLALGYTPQPSISCPCLPTPSGGCIRNPSSSPGPAPAPPLIAEDYQALLAFRDESSALEFLRGNDDPCTWTFPTSPSSKLVLCFSESFTNYQQRATTVSLNGLQYQDLSGSIALDRLSNLTALTSIFISNADLIGVLPAFWANLPRLTSLTVRNTSISGTIPAEWFSATALPAVNSLVISDNNLTGQLPEIDNSTEVALKIMTNLDVSRNQLTGTLPISWGSWHAVATMDVSSNSLSGSLPEIWGSNSNFGRLSRLNASNNNFEGTLPPSWGNVGAFSRTVRAGDYNLSYSTLASTVSLILNGNPGLTGAIPTEWSQSGADTFYQVMNVYAQPGTGICGQAPPYVVVFEQVAASPDNLYPNATNQRANLAECVGSPSISLGQASG